MTTTTIDKTNTESYPMAGQCPFGGDRIGGAFGSRPALENWYPHRLRVELLHQNGLAADPLGPGFRLRRRLPDDRPRRAEERHQAVPDLVGGVVAVRLRQLRPADDPHGLALGRHLPHRGRAGRRRHRDAALRADLELVGQRQHRQVAPPPAADQAQVRQRPVLGRPDGAHRQLRPGDHGPADLRLRRRAPRRLGGGRRHLLGAGGRRDGLGLELRRDGQPRSALARQERRRRVRPGEPTRRLAPGADLREPRRPLRERRPAGLGQRHPRDVHPHGHERRGDRGADRRRPCLRQEPRHDPRQGDRAAAGDGADGGDGARLAQPEGHGGRQGHDDQRHRGQLDPRPDPVGQRLPGEPLQVRLGADQEPGRRPAMDAEGPERAQDARRPCRGADAPAHDDDLRHRPQGRSGVPQGLREVPRRLRRLHAGLLQGVVQAHPPRHGPQAPLPRPGGDDRGRPAVAGSDPRCRLRPDRRGRDRRPQAGDPGHGPLGLGPRLHGLLGGLDLPRQRQARRRQRRPPRPRAAEGLGRQPPGRARGRGAARGHGRVQRRAQRRQAGLARRPHRARRLRRRGEGGPGCRGRDARAVHARPGRHHAGRSPTSRCSVAEARRRTASATTSTTGSGRWHRACRRRRCSSTRPTC